jgi:GTPase Era involved in 16S rRNA processing
MKKLFDEYIDKSLVKFAESVDVKKFEAFSLENLDKGRPYMKSKRKHDELRMDEISDAIIELVTSGKHNEIPHAWINEYNDIVWRRENDIYND